MFKCAVCGKGPADEDGGVSLYRMNNTGQKGLFSCNEHKDHFDGRISDDVREIVNMIEGKKNGGS